jgi:hypothetical protein
MLSGPIEAMSIVTPPLVDRASTPPGEIPAVDPAVGRLRLDLAGQRGERDLSVGIGDVDHGIFRRADVVAHLEGGADHDAAHPLGLERDAVRLDVFLDDDPRQQFTGRRVGGAPGNLFGLHLDGRPVGALDLDFPVGIDDPDFAAGLERVAAGPLVGRPGREVAERQVAAGQEQRQRQQQERRSVARHSCPSRTSSDRYARRGAQFNWTEISFGTPGSSMVTP